MRLAFWLFPAEGHLNPMLTLARKIRDRGHDVFCVGIADCEPAARRAGFEFFCFAKKQFPSGSRNAWETRLSELHGLACFRYALETFCKSIDIVMSEAVDVVRDTGPDAIIADEVDAGSFLVAAQIGVPLIHVANAMPLHSHDSIPPTFLPWQYRTGALARLRNRLGYAAFGVLMRPYLSRIAEHQRRLGLPVDRRSRNSSLSTLAQITQLPAGFDFPSSELPPWFYHTGPFHDGQGRLQADFPWERLTGEPIIYASMGSILGSEPTFRTIVEACSGLGCQLVMSIGKNVTAESLAPLPENCITASYVPQLEVLRRAALCITHAGLNTTLEALAAGVPLVAVPVTNDQPAVAARIEHSRTGIIVPYRKLTVQRLRRAVQRVLCDRAYSDAARSLQSEMRATNGLERAADIIEERLGVKRHSEQAASSGRLNIRASAPLVSPGANVN